jgi:type IV secretion system protein VirD4
MSRNKCIIVPRNSFAIFGTRNFYFADAELLKRAWLPIPLSKASMVKVDNESAISARPRRGPDFNDMLLPPLLTRQDANSQICGRPRGAVFAAKAGKRPAPPARPMDVKISSAARSTKSTYRLAEARNQPDLAAITRAAGRDETVSSEVQSRIAAVLGRVASLAARAEDRVEAEAAIRDLTSAVKDVT